MPPIKVTYAALAEAHTDINLSWGRIDDQLSQLRGYVARLAAGWEGESAALYQEKQKQWDVAAAGISDVLMRIGRAVDEANRNYQTTENTNAGRWRA